MANYKLSKNKNAKKSSKTNKEKTIIKTQKIHVNFTIWLS